ncbi:MAG: type II toxin-antitoxin system HicB family antitoxin [Nitrosomonadales bacterium]|nr:type II toxin-antitoxin system HicB family antitoxin [Nitrosomonadales bacterium]
MTSATIKSIESVQPTYPFEAYSHVISPLSQPEGGGFLITFPDLPGCMSDGATEIEAIANGRDAFLAWISARLDAGKEIPQPSYRPDSLPDVSGRFVTRLPKSVHAKLAERAKAEGVSLNTLVLTFVAEGLGRRAA